jgi:hypothetical protein
MVRAIVKNIGDVPVASTSNFGLTKLPNGEVRIQGGSGHGSTNTRIRRFTTPVINAGTSISYQNSVANGDTFTINEAGIYSIHYTESSSADAFFGISVNSNQLTTSITSITDAHRKASAKIVAGNPSLVSVTVALSQNDVVRAHTNSAVNGTEVQIAFHITQVSKL